MLYLQKYFSNFQKHSLCWKKRNMAIVLENFLCTEILVFFNSNVTTFPKSRKCKNFNFSLYTVPAEMPYLRKYLMNLQKLFFGWKMRKVVIGAENFLCTEIGFCNSNVTTFQNPENVKISIFPFTLSRQKRYIFKSI